MQWGLSSVEVTMITEEMLDINYLNKKVCRDFINRTHR